MPTAGAGPAYFVATNGDDLNNGSQLSPWRTLGKALASVPAWSRIYVRAGSYNESVNVDKVGIAVEGYPGDPRPKIWAQNQEEKPAWVIRLNYTKSGFGADDCLLRNLEISGGSYYSIKTESNWDWGGDTLPEQRHGASRLVVEDCKVGDSGRDAFKFTPGSRDCVVRRCEVHDTGKRDASNADGIDAVNADRLLVEDSWFHDIATNGLYLKGGTAGGIVRRNRIERCGAGGIGIGFYTDLDYFDLLANPDAYENLHCLVYNNWVSDVAQHGIGCFSAFRPLIWHNTVLRAARSGRSAFNIDCGNTLPPTWTQVRPCRRVTAFNNIFQVDPSAGRPVVEIRNNGLTRETDELHLRSNRYDAISGQVIFKDSRKDRPFYGDLAAWKVHTGQDLDSLQGDLRLGTSGVPLPDSFCRNAATKLPDVRHDLVGYPRSDGKPDVGCYEGG